MNTIIFKDETMTGTILNTWSLPIVYETLSVRDIIQARVYKEVDKYNETTSTYFNGLIQPDQTESTLNGYKMKKHRKINPEEQFQKAIEGFQSNSFMILINNRQVETLDEIIPIDENIEISFIKLIPLVGG
jgi:selenophosphate synthase